MRDILITGASSGIGKELAISFANNKTTLHLLARDEEKLLKVKDLCEKKGATVEIKICDVRDRQAMKEYVANLCQNNRLDLIIANAGISAGTAKGLEDDEQVYEIFETNLFGVLNTIQPALGCFSKRKKGKILIMSSLASYLALPSCPAYSASKAAVRFYGNALGDFVKKYNIDIRVISPGYIKTEMTKVNKFPMPFLMETEEAARHIEIKLENSANPNIAFPWPTYFITWFVGILPRRITGWFLRKLPGKKSFKQ